MTDGVVFMQVTDFRAWMRVTFVRRPTPRCAPAPRFAPAGILAGCAGLGSSTAPRRGTAWRRATDASLPAGAASYLR